MFNFATFQKHKKDEGIIGALDTSLLYSLSL